MQTSLEEKENELVLSLKSGNRQALGALYELHVDKLYFFCLKICKSPVLAEDVVQDVFVKVWQNRESINLSHAFQSYLYTIARNRLFDLIKRASRESEIYQEMVAHISSLGHSVDQTLEYKECQNLVSDAISKLPSRRQLIFRLSREDGLSYAEIAKKLDISPGTVNIQMVKALKSIRDYLELSREMALILVFLFIQ